MSNFTQLLPLAMIILGTVFLQWGINLIVISTVSFMHFHLGHGLNIIDEWIHYFGWPLVTIIKVMGVWVMFKWLSARQASSSKSLLKMIWGHDNPEIYVVSAFVLLFAMVFGFPKLMSYKSMEVIQWFIHLICVVIFFTSDHVIIAALKHDGRFSTFSLFVASLISVVGVMLSNRVIYRVFNFHEKTLLVFLLVGCVICAWSHFSIKNVMIYFAIAIAPLMVFFGIDPIHDVYFSIFEMTRPLEGMFQLILSSLSITYLIIKDKKRRLLMEI